MRLLCIRRQRTPALPTDHTSCGCRSRRQSVGTSSQKPAHVARTRRGIGLPRFPWCSHTWGKRLLRGIGPALDLLKRSIGAQAYIPVNIHVQDILCVNSYTIWGSTVSWTGVRASAVPTRFPVVRFDVCGPTADQNKTWCRSTCLRAAFCHVSSKAGGADGGTGAWVRARALQASQPSRLVTPPSKRRSQEISGRALPPPWSLAGATTTIVGRHLRRDCALTRAHTRYAGSQWPRGLPR